MDRASIAREKIEKKRQNQKNASSIHAENLSETKNKINKEEIKNAYQRIDDLENHIDVLYELILKYKNLLNQLVDEKHQTKNIIMSNLLQIYLDEDFDEYSKEFYQMCYDVIKESEISYLILCKYLPFLPSIQKVKEYYEVINFSECLTNIDEMGKIITFYKKRNEIKGEEKLYACLAVDALFLYLI